MSKRKFRHPVFGNRNVWVTQPGRPWFGTTIRDNSDEARDALRAALRRIASR